MSSQAEYVGYVESVGLQGSYNYLDVLDELDIMDDCNCEYCNEGRKRKINTMSKDYMTSRGYDYATEAEALASAKQYAAKNFDDVKVYKAYKIVSTTTPNVDVKDYVIT